MAKTVEEATVYIQTEKLLTRVRAAVTQYPREFKFDEGGKAKMLCIDMLTELARIYNSRDNAYRMERFSEFHSLFDTVKMMLRQAYFVEQWIPPKKYAEMLEIIDKIKTEAGAWRRSIEKHIQSPSRESRYGQGHTGGRPKSM